MKTEERKKLSFAQAYLCLNVKDGAVHTFRQGGVMLIGYDWGLENLIEALKKYEDTIELTGKMARGMGHGITFCDDYGYVFVETVEKELVELEEILNSK